MKAQKLSFDHPSKGSGMPKKFSALKVLFVGLIALTALFSPSSAWSSAQPEFVPETLGDAQKRIRIDHAQELLGRYYSRSQVKYGENVKKINSQIYRWTRDRLPKAYRHQHAKIAQTIIDESLRHGFDPVFLLSVIQSESRFNPEAKGRHGEIGLMQILPPTGKWMAEKSGQKWKGSKTLKDNVANIRLGAAYFAFLRDRFDMHARLYIAAYNMGQHGVDNALEKKIWPKDYPGLVMKNYVEFYNELEDSKREPTSIQARR